MFTIRSRGIDSTEVCLLGSKRTSRIVSECGGSLRSAASLDPTACPAEDQERLWAAVVFGRDDPLGRVDLVELRKDLFGDARDLFRRAWRSRRR